MKKRIGIIGVGEMGFPILVNLKEMGYNVAAYARRKEIRDRIAEKGIEVLGTPKELAEKSDIILDILNDTNSTWSVLKQENGMLEGLGPNKILVDMTTSDPNESIPLGEFLEEKGVAYIDCPITGGKIGAENRQLICMAAGREEAFNEVKPILESVSKKVFYLGKMGGGHYMKLIHNQLSHSTFLASCEAVNLGKALGMDPATMIEVFNIGNARSYATEVRFPKFILPETYNAGASFKTVQKDIGIVMKKIEALGIEMPITAATYMYWSYPIEHDKGDDDYSTIFTLMNEINKR